MRFKRNHVLIIVECMVKWTCAINWSGYCSIVICCTNNFNDNDECIHGCVIELLIVFVNGTVYATYQSKVVKSMY